jgi:dTDP-4-amino-4,6-dideoxygalactose transaminase
VIPISAPVVGELEERLVLEVLGSGRLAQGPMVERFERAVAESVGTRHAVAVNSGTSALVVALLAHGIGPGDEVVTSPITFAATLNAILFVGATPRFVDVGEDLTIDPDLVADAIGPSTRAVVPVHLYGYPADIGGLSATFGGRPIALIEDAAQALGATIDGRSVGSFGTGCFSFYATKNATTGEGGAVTTDRDDVATFARRFANQGQRARYDYAFPGVNFRMSELHAALGVAQMTRLDDMTARRRRNARFLADSLCDLDGVVLPRIDAGRTHVFHHFTIRVTSRARMSRDEVLRHLRSRDVDAGVYYPTVVYDAACFRADPRVGAPSTPRARAAVREVLSLPVHPRVSEAELATVAAAVREVLA